MSEDVYDVHKLFINFFFSYPSSKESCFMRKQTSVDAAETIPDLLRGYRNFSQRIHTGTGIVPVRKQASSVHISEWPG